jgi:hypothetical protein
MTEKSTSHAIPASHTHKSNVREHFDVNHQVDSVSKSHHTSEQVARDAKMIAALIGPGIMQHYPSTGETRLETERAFFPSRTRLEPIEAEEGQPTLEITGGWLTRQEALLELSAPTSVVVELPPIQPDEQAA